MSPAPVPERRKRRPQRREQILAAAIQLFRERGYDATGVDDIGAVAGITGPGIYRHFRNKQEILETLLRERGESVLAEVEDIVGRDAAPRETLESLTAHYVDTLVDDPAMAIVAMYERRTLTAGTRTVVERMERRNIEHWVTVVRHVRPDVGEAEARVMVLAALTLGVAVCNVKHDLADPSLRALMRSMITTALEGAGSTAGSGR